MSLLSQGFSQNLHAVFCLAENAVGPHATRPDDIHTLYSGKTVEINNTDAEGRLVLGDGVAYARKDLKADWVVDMATLTGAQVNRKYTWLLLLPLPRCKCACTHIFSALQLSPDLVLQLWRKKPKLRDKIQNRKLGFKAVSLPPYIASVPKHYVWVLGLISVCLCIYLPRVSLWGSTMLVY